MSIIRFALIGAAIAYGINHITKKRADGTSIMDDLADKAPEWMDKGKRQIEETIDQVAGSLKKQNSTNNTVSPPY